MVEENLPGCLEGVSPDPLHDLRVAVRRSRSVLRQLWRVFPRGQRRVQARNLGWIQDVTGPARDLDVLLLEWGYRTGGLPLEARHALEPVHDLLVARRGDVFAVMRRKLSGPKFGRRWSAWRSFLAGEVGDAEEGPHAGRTIEAVVGKRARSLHRRMVKDGSKIDRSSPAEALHDLRKRGKELRYLLELFGDVWPDGTIEPIVGTLKGLQDALGDHQDLVVQMAALRSLQDEIRTGDDLGSRASLQGLDQVIDHLHREQGDARARFLAGSAAFAGTEPPLP